MIPVSMIPVSMIVPSARPPERWVSMIVQGG